MSTTGERLDTLERKVKRLEAIISAYENFGSSTDPAIEDTVVTDPTDLMINNLMLDEKQLMDSRLQDLVRDGHLSPQDAFEQTEVKRNPAPTKAPARASTPSTSISTTTLPHRLPMPKAK